MTLLGAALFSVGCYACTFDGDTSLQPGDIAPNRPDAWSISRDADLIDADPALQRHLVLSEVKNTVAGTEFIEIYNPSENFIFLADYYLADNAAYPLVPSIAAGGPKPNVFSSDFVARFPADAVIAPGQVIVIGVNSKEFTKVFGQESDYKIGKDGTGVAMLKAFPASVGKLSSITDSGEGIALFYWDGQSDLVTDIDLLTAGHMTTPANELINKTNLSVDGPDPDDLPSTYKNDLATMGGFLTGTQGLQSFVRIKPEVGFEQQLGTGNGRYGHDETSEDIGLTWGIIDQATPGFVPTL